MGRAADFAAPFLAPQVMAEDGNADKDTANQKVTWVERDVQKWEGYEPKIELVYDMKHGFLLSVYIQITRRVSTPSPTPRAAPAQPGAHSACARIGARSGLALT